MRRLAAMVYDSFLVIAIWMLSSTMLVVWVGDGEALTGPVFQLFLYLEWFFFYYVFWRMRGQTLGMQVWKINTLQTNGEIMTARHCVLRFLFATLTLIPFGIGFFWMLFDRRRLTLWDIASNTRVIYLGNKPYPSETR